MGAVIFVCEDCGSGRKERTKQTPFVEHILSRACEDQTKLELSEFTHCSSAFTYLSNKLSYGQCVRSMPPTTMRRAIVRRVRIERSSEVIANSQVSVCSIPARRKLCAFLFLYL